MSVPTPLLAVVHPHAPRISLWRQRSVVAPATDAITATDTDRLPTKGRLML